MKIPVAKAAVEKNWKIVEIFGMAADKSQKQKKRRSMKQGIRAEKFILRH